MAKTTSASDRSKGTINVDKTYSSASEAVADIPDGASIAVGRFGLCGILTALITALREQGTGDLELISNNCGVDDWGLGVLLADRRVRRVVASYVGENREFARQWHQPSPHHRGPCRIT
ncbi:hypothetical protein J7E80_16485 [Arthrobacter sp. ISL-28]|nr:hypothetical protein [Arthrobacter sp. ISL-28]